MAFLIATNLPRSDPTTTHFPPPRHAATLQEFGSTEPSEINGPEDTLGRRFHMTPDLESAAPLPHLVANQYLGAHASRFLAININWGCTQCTLGMLHQVASMSLKEV